MKKLKSRRGETLTETLVSVLIIAMAAALLATMVGVSTRLTARAGAEDEKFYRELSDAEAGAAAADGEIILTVDGAGRRLRVSVAGGGGELTSYRLEVSQ